MRKDDISAWIRKEVSEDPAITNIQLAEKYRLPMHIIEIFKKKLIMNDTSNE